MVLRMLVSLVDVLVSRGGCLNIYVSICLLDLLWY